MQNNPQNSFNGFLIRPIDTEDLQRDQIQQPLPAINRMQSSKSPQNFQSPDILDFLDDDAYFNLEDKQKSKTEFARRERQDSYDSDNAYYYDEI